MRLFLQREATQTPDNNLVPVKTYSNADKEKESVYKENRKKSGVYCWTNLINGNRYVGSSVNLTRRFSWYYNLTTLVKHKKVSLMSKALLKYGHSEFRLDILEYCDSNEVLKREQYYLDLLNQSTIFYQKLVQLLGTSTQKKLELS